MIKYVESIIDDVMISHQPRLCIRDSDQILMVIYLMGLFGQIWAAIVKFLMVGVGVVCWVRYRVMFSHFE